MVNTSDLAERKTVQAFYLRGTLAIFASGTIPSAQHRVSIERCPAAVQPPHFYLVQRNPRGISTIGPTAFTVSQLFSIGHYCQIVRVAHASGTEEVEVEELPTESRHLRQPPPYVFPPSAIRSGSDCDTATGYSAAYDFGEALREAVAALPPIGDFTSPTPDSVTVLEVGAESGGIAGFDHLFVRVRRTGEAHRFERGDARPNQASEASSHGPYLMTTKA